MANKINFDVVLIGGGMVGLCIANQIIERGISKSLCIIDKENKLGLHSSGRNSGVLHAGIYYKPKSLKAKVCVSGALRLKEWIKERNLPINNCGKLIVPQSKILDSQLDVLKERGRANGAKVELINEKEIYNFCPYANSASGRAIWSENTSVVNPKIIINELEKELVNKGVTILKGEKEIKYNPEQKNISLLSKTLNYGHLINCAGLEAAEIAHKFNVGKNYYIIPFKGIYWQIKKSSSIKISTNVYPVPDLNMPFLGVHFTPDANSSNEVSIGPTATFAFGRENYEGLKNVEILRSFRNLSTISKLYFVNSGGFRGYIHNQSLQNIPFIMINEAKKIIPRITLSEIEPSKKVGIRSQLYNKSHNKFEDDFICKNGYKSTHLMNAISPAFTSSFALADLVLEYAKLI